jgi:hypothetical protein
MNVSVNAVLGTARTNPKLHAISLLYAVFDIIWKYSTSYGSYNSKENVIMGIQRRSIIPVYQDYMRRSKGCSSCQR